MRVQLRGVQLPGRRFECFDEIQVGLRVGKEVCQVTAADAEDACWETEVRVRESGGGYDFAGPAVRGRKGERVLGLAWLDGTGEMFRAAKLALDLIPETVIADTLRAGGCLVATIRLTDDRGGPLCASVPETHVTWERAP